MADENQRLGLGLGSFQNTPEVTPEFDQKASREQRRESTSVTDLTASMYRQDSFVPGLIAEALGDDQLLPDPSYNVFDDKDVEKMAQGLPEQYMPHVWRAHSRAHAVYTIERLKEKVVDQQRLEDTGALGEAGRLALGFVAPENLLALGTGFVASKGLQAGRMAMAARGLSGISKAAVVAEGAAAQVAARGTAKAVAAGSALGATENYAFEALRQRVGFEDSESQRMMAGALGGLLTLPFAVAGARSARRISDAAEQEASALRALADANDGKDLTPDQVKLVNDLHAKTQVVQKLEAGELTQEEALEALQKGNPRPVKADLEDDFMGPVETDEMFLDRLQERTRGQAQEVIQRFRDDASETTKLIQHQARQWTSENVKARREGRRKLIEERKAQEAAGPTLLDLQSAPTAKESALGSALKKAFDDAGVDLGTKLSRDRLDPAGPPVELKARTAEMKQAKADAWAAAEASQASARKAEEERAYTQRELLDAHMADPHFEAPAVEPAPRPQEFNPEARPHDDDLIDSLVGQEVSWMDREGNILDGKVTKVNRFEQGTRVVVKTSEGVKSVDPKSLDQWPSEPPVGFLPSSVGAAQALPIQYLEDVDKLSSRFTGYSTVPGTKGKVKIPPRFDLYAFFNESDNPVVRALGNALVRDPVGFKDKTRAQGMTASEWRDHIRRTVGGEFHLTARDAALEAMKASKVPLWDKVRFNAKFYEAVSMLTRGDTSALNQFPQAAHAALRKASTAQQKAMADMLTKLKQAGVEGADQIDPNGSYVSRVWRQDKIRQAEELHGKDNVIKLLADSFYGMTAKGPLVGDTKKAASFLKVIKKLEFSTTLMDMHLASRDMHTLREELSHQGLAQDDIDTLVDVMFEARHVAQGQEGKPGNLKARMSIDETAALQTPAGVLRIHDLIENDSRILVDRYVQTMGGHYGLARMGFTSPASFRAKLKEAMDLSIEKNLGDRSVKEQAWLNDVYAHITGKPMSMADYSGTARFFAAFRGYTRAVTLGQLGLTAAFELKQAVGVMGLRTLRKQLPSLHGFFQALRSGHIPDPGLAKQILQISGHGAEMASAYARAREISEDLPAQVLNGAEHWANRMSHAVDVVSGNASITSFTRQLSAKMSVQFLHDVKLTPEVRARLAGHGLEGQWADDVITDLKQFANVRGDVVEQLRLDDWLAQAPDTYEAFQVFVGRQVRDAVQDHDIGETMPFMHSTLGKVFAELKTFFLVAHAKNMLKNTHYMDGTTMGVLMYGMVGEAMAFAIQQAMNYPDKLDERLSPEVMGPAVMSRMAALGFMPMLAETGYQMVTGESLLAAGSTSSGTNNRNLMMTPSFQVMGALASVPGILTQTAMGTDPLTPGDIRMVAKTLPLSNTYAARGLVNWWAEAQQP